MVSYHFGSKLGILRSIFASFFDQYNRVLEHQNVFRIVTTELPRYVRAMRKAVVWT